MDIPLIYHGCYTIVGLIYKIERNWTKCMEKCRTENFVFVGMKVNSYFAEDCLIN